LYGGSLAGSAEVAQVEWAVGVADS